MKIRDKVPRFEREGYDPTARVLKARVREPVRDPTDSRRMARGPRGSVGSIRDKPAIRDYRDCLA